MLPNCGGIFIGQFEMPLTEAQRAARRDYYWDHWKRLSDATAADLDNPSDEFWDERNDILDQISRQP